MFCQGATNNAFAFTGGIAVAGVDQIDASVQGAQENGRGLGGGQGVGEIIRPQRQRGNFDAGAT